MIWSIRGKVVLKRDHAAVIDAHGIGLKIIANQRTLRSLPAVGGEAQVYTHLHLHEGGHEGGIELFGFRTPEELSFFEELISVSGVGPKSALAVMDVDELTQLQAAIKAGRPDLLSRAPGVGRKTAERIIVELKNKVSISGSEAAVKAMDVDADLVEALAGLGYRRDEARAAVSRMGDEPKELEARLKAALKILGGKK